MKVALLIPTMEIGGVAQYVLTLGKALRACGDDVTVVVTGARREWWELLSENGLRGAHIPLRSWDSRVQHVLHLARYLAQEKFDVVVSNIGSANWAGQQSLDLLPDHVPALVVLHNHYDRVYALAQISRNGWNLALAVSPQVQQTAAAHFPDKAVHFIPHGVRFPTDGELKQRTDWSQPLRLLYVGHLADRQKGIFLLPRIVCACRELGLAVTLTLVGDGADRQEMVRLASAAGVADRIKLVGPLPTAVVYQMMRAHHILLLPSNYEGFGFVLIEAQANGCVPVASWLPGVTDVNIADGETGLLAPPGDSLAFAQQIAALADPVRWRAFSQAGIARTRALFSVEMMGNRTRALLQELVDGAAPLARPRSQGHIECIRRFAWRDFIPSGPLAEFRRLRVRLGRNRRPLNARHDGDSHHTEKA